MAAAGTDNGENRDRTTHNNSSGGVRVAVAILVAIVIAGRPTRAEDGWNPPHVRPETAATQELVAIAITRSPTIRALIERLERSDVVVYIRHRQFPDSLLDGRIARSMDLPDVKERLTTLGFDRVDSAPDALAAHMQAQTAIWSKVVRDAGKSDLGARQAADAAQHERGAAQAFGGDGGFQCATQIVARRQANGQCLHHPATSPRPCAAPTRLAPRPSRPAAEVVCTIRP